MFAGLPCTSCLLACWVQDVCKVKAAQLGLSTMQATCYVSKVWLALSAVSCFTVVHTCSSMSCSYKFKPAEGMVIRTNVKPERILKALCLFLVFSLDSLHDA